MIGSEKVFKNFLKKRKIWPVQIGIEGEGRVSFSN
jgi:hypothetical protein